MINKKSVTIAIALLLIAVLAAVVVSDVTKMAREDSRRSKVMSLAISIETYRDRNDEYPVSFEEIISMEDQRGRGRQHIERIRDRRFGDIYDFRITTDGFVITVTRPKLFFQKDEIVDYHYGIDEVWKLSDVKPGQKR